MLHIFVRCIEALTRAGQSDRQLLPKAVSMFEVCYREFSLEEKNNVLLGLFTVSQSCGTLHRRNI